MGNKKKKSWLFRGAEEEKTAIRGVGEAVLIWRKLLKKMKGRSNGSKGKRGGLKRYLEGKKKRLSWGSKMGASGGEQKSVLSYELPGRKRRAGEKRLNEKRSSVLWGRRSNVETKKNLCQIKWGDSQ